MSKTHEAKALFEKLKTAHELPNDNSGEYNLGYVDAMNMAINTVKKIEGLKDSKKWVRYSWEDKDSHPPKAGKYWIYRQGCNKQHSEQWNGSGWSSSNNDCTHWQPLPQPPKT